MNFTLDDLARSIEEEHRLREAFGQARKSPNVGEYAGLFANLTDRPDDVYYFKGLLHEALGERYLTVDGLVDALRQKFPPPP